MPGGESLQANWKGGDPLPFESLWSVAHRFCCLNFLTGSELVRTFRSASEPAAWLRVTLANRRRCVGYDLRFRGVLDLEAISAAAGFGDKWCGGATLDRCGTRSRGRTESTGYLRYCRRCMETGFHSVAFQITAVERCPIHELGLEEFCPKCGNQIPYTLPAGGARAFHCRCGYALYWASGGLEWPRALVTEGAKRRFSRWAQQMLEPKRASRSNPCDLDLDPLPLEGECDFNSEVPCISRRWDGDFIQRRWPKKLERDNQVVPTRDAALRSKISTIFRQVDRAIFRRRLSSRERACARAIGRGCRIKTRGDGGLATGYALWRSYWLSPLVRPRHADYSSNPWETGSDAKTFIRFARHTALVRSKGVFSTADEWAQLHIAAIVAFRTFDACVARVRQRATQAVSIENEDFQFLRDVIPPMAVLMPDLWRPRTFFLYVR